MSGIDFADQPPVLIQIVSALTLALALAYSYEAPLAHRTGKEACWAQLNQSSDQICFTKDQWSTLLKRPHAGVLQVTQKGWATRSAPMNDWPSKPKRARSVRLWVVSRNGHGQKLEVHIHQKIEQIRQWLSDQLENDRLGILRSLLLNEKSLNSPIPLLRQLGFVHISTASGIHLYALSEWAMTIIKTIFRGFGLSPSLGLHLGRYVSLLVSLLAWVLSGARLGLLRPWFVISLREISLGLGIKWKSYSPLVCALALEGAGIFFSSLFQDRGEHFSGRWTYALAVGGGIMGQRLFRTPLLSHAGLAVGSWILPAVFEVLEHSTVAFATAPLSLCTLPIYCLVIYPSCLLGVFLAAVGAPWWGQTILQRTSEVTSSLTETLAGWSLHTGNLWMIPKWTLLAGGILGALAMMKPLPFRCLALACALGVRLALTTSETKPDSLGATAARATKIIQLDIGQGDAALVKDTYGAWGLLDVGHPHVLSDSQWLQLLAQRKIQSLNWVAFTHLDSDHSGGALQLARVIKLNCATTSRAQIQTPRGRKFSAELQRLKVEHGLEPWEAGCIPFPVAGPSGNEKENAPNAHMSAVLIPLVQGGFYLSAGDADDQRELELLSWVGKVQKETGSACRILKVSHHGSRFSTSSEWLKSLDPEEAWISVGPANSYGHPHPKVLGLLRDLKIPTHRTDLEGALQWSIRREESSP